MRIFDELFDRGADADDLIRNQQLPVRNTRLNDKEIISVDAEEVSQDSSGRPPIIFENGCY